MTVTTLRPHKQRWACKRARRKARRIALTEVERSQHQQVQRSIEAQGFVVARLPGKRFSASRGSHCCAQAASLNDLAPRLAQEVKYGLCTAALFQALNKLQSRGRQTAQDTVALLLAIGELPTPPTEEAS